jgi:peptidoglycan/LPS O-acetylase OafA/YrhL
MGLLCFFSQKLNKMGLLCLNGFDMLFGFWEKYRAWVWVCCVCMVLMFCLVSGKNTEHGLQQIKQDKP